jgi:N-acetyltransferase
MPSLSTRDTVTGVVAEALEPFTLRGAHVELVPLAPHQAGELAAAALGDRSTYVFTDVPDDVEKMGAYIAKLLGQRARGDVVPFAQRRVDDDRLVGCTRFMELRHWRGRAEPDEVEIGGTWLAADAQRTPVNTEAKLLMLTHAFEVWRVWRVELCTDARNERSWKAIKRLGARHEGVLRNHRPSYVAGEAGRPRDSALFAITETEWPEVRDRLVQRLEGG